MRSDWCLKKITGCGGATWSKVAALYDTGKSFVLVFEKREDPNNHIKENRVEYFSTYEQAFIAWLKNKKAMQKEQK